MDNGVVGTFETAANCVSRLPVVVVVFTLEAAMKTSLTVLSGTYSSLKRSDELMFGCVQVMEYGCERMFVLLKIFSIDLNSCE
ncbi:hypothetical protein CDAR_458751 [Caerostris darwini]|uniref:Uncharacterized protein n=1 Tax=Caerostris darwini TaxID=1538125 RepID=A0AAV4MUA7_9ARAC|nr:hypothetical protein CDAR_458751 [Caerostris darwini]